MILDGLLLLFFYFVLPLVGLLLGAVVSPFLYSRHLWLGLLLNLSGFVLYVFLITAPLSYVLLPSWNPDGGNSFYPGGLLVLGIEMVVFAATEGLAWGLRHLCRCEILRVNPKVD